MKSKIDSIENFIKSLSKYENSSNLTNLYRGNSQLSQIRRENLKLYFDRMKKINPSILLLGEAPGYKGCRLTGIPFTSERILENNEFFKDQAYKLLNEDQSLESEISATIVWNELDNYESKALIWNIFPFHPHKHNNISSNRTPTKEELKQGKEYLMQILDIFDIKKIIALGRKAESKIIDMDINNTYVRHPANGGKNEFMRGLRVEMK